MGIKQQDTVYKIGESRLEQKEIDSFIGSLVTDPEELGAYGVIISFLNEKIATKKANLLAKIRWLTGRWQGDFVYFSLRDLRIL